MRQQVEATSRDAVLVEDATLIRVMGIPVLEAVPSRGAPYELTDPFILVHEGRFRPSEMAGRDTKHPHRGFDNLWYVLHGSASTGHSTGAGRSPYRCPPSSRASPTCWMARPRSGPTTAGRDLRSSFCWVRVRSSQLSTRRPEPGTCSWPGSRTVRRRCSTGLSWISECGSARRPDFWEVLAMKDEKVI